MSKIIALILKNLNLVLKEREGERIACESEWLSERGRERERGGEGK